MLTSSNGTNNNERDLGEDLISDRRAWSTGVDFVAKLFRYWPLFFVLFLICIAVVGVSYTVVKPTFTAAATIGPPNSSPTSSLLAGGGAAGAGSQSVRRLLGGVSGSTAGNDPFQEYLQLLHSYRLAHDLAEKDNLLQRVYAARWDAENRRWKQSGILHRVVGFVKNAMHRPVSGAPNASDLQAFLSLHLQTAPVRSANTSSFLNSNSNFIDVSFDYGDRQEAVEILEIVLHRADDIIRQEQLRDVLARITFIDGELAKVTQAEQRDALIQTLSNQQQLRIMMVADKQFASTLIDTPHVWEIPSSPPPPQKAFMTSMLVALALWALLVLLEGRSELIRMLIWRFRRGAKFDGVGEL